MNCEEVFHGLWIVTNYIVVSTCIFLILLAPVAIKHLANSYTRPHNNTLQFVCYWLLGPSNFETCSVAFVNRLASVVVLWEWILCTWWWLAVVLLELLRYFKNSQTPLGSFPTGQGIQYDCDFSLLENRELHVMSTMHGCLVRNPTISEVELPSVWSKLVYQNWSLLITLKTGFLIPYWLTMHLNSQSIYIHKLLGNQEPHHYKHVEQMRTSTFDLLRWIVVM